SLPADDFEGDVRIFGSDADMGADEFAPHFYTTGDAVAGGSVAGKLVGMPATAPVGIWLGSGVLDPPQSSAFGLWYLMAPWIGPILLPPIPANGVFILPATLPSSPAGPYEIPMQAIIGDELSNLCILEVPPL
ncbi:MAG: hypothetical protein ACYTG7_19520, partial [Planctomycetota bacterium]